MPYKNLEQKKESDRKYYKNNKEKIVEYIKEWRKENKEKVRKYSKKWRQKNPEYNKKYQIEYQKENKEKIKKRVKKHRQKNTQARIAYLLRKRIGEAVRNNRKAGSAVRDLGCTIPELKKHLENQFKEGMSWDNWGREGWHIDHIVPLSSFDLTDRKQFLEAVHYTNLQPLWAEDNLKKGNKPLYLLM